MQRALHEYTGSYRSESLPMGWSTLSLTLNDILPPGSCSKDVCVRTQSSSLSREPTSLLLEHTSLRRPRRVVACTESELQPGSPFMVNGHAATACSFMMTASLFASVHNRNCCRLLDFESLIVCQSQKSSGSDACATSRVSEKESAPRGRVSVCTLAVS